MAAPVVSVAICMRNGARYVCETLESVFAQTFQDFEIILVDDGSSDGGADEAERLFGDPRLIVVRQPPLTLREARPAAVAHCRGEFIAFLDHDDLWFPKKLERQVEALRQHPSVALGFSDCVIIDAGGTATGRLSDAFRFRELDLAAGRAHLELLWRGNFVAYSSAIVRTAAVRAVGGFSRAYQYVSDYDLWLRLARQFDLYVGPEPLAKYRVHDTQFTQRHSDITLAEHVALLMPIIRGASYLAATRQRVGDHLFGQHRVAFELLRRQRRFSAAARAAAGMLRLRRHSMSYLRDRLRGRVAGSFMELGAIAATGIRRIEQRTRRAPARVARVLSARRSREHDAEHVWMDGSSLGLAQTGYFSLVTEWVRALITERPSEDRVVHVVTTAGGRAAVRARLGADASRIHFHRIGWRELHWLQIYAVLAGWRVQLLSLAVAALLALAAFMSGALIPLLTAAAAMLLVQAGALLDLVAADFRAKAGRPRLTLAARALRWLWRRLPAPRGFVPNATTTEIVVWRGRFRWRDAHRIGVVQDLTTRLHPELHTPENISEMDEFLRYVERHAHSIVTVSEHSRRDIIAGLGVSPDAVRVLPMPVHPQYAAPMLDRALIEDLAIRGPYILTVGTLEPRKNLRRLIRAFEILWRNGETGDYVLVLAGPAGWDPGLADFIASTEVRDRIRALGFVRLEQMPPLYHFASAVIYPSLYEGFGLPVLEAMCASAVVLASRSSALPEMLGNDGMLFDPLDTSAIAAALRQALSLSPVDAAAHRRRCRARAEAHLARAEREPRLPS